MRNEITKKNAPKIVLKFLESSQELLDLYDIYNYDTYSNDWDKIAKHCGLLDESDLLHLFKQNEILQESLFG